MAGDHSEIETDWMQAAKGYVEKNLGAEIVSVGPDMADLNRIEIAIPEMNERVIEEVLVIGKRDDVDYRIKLEKQVEFIKDFEGGKSGLVVYLKQDVQFKLLINYIDYNEPSSIPK